MFTKQNNHHNKYAIVIMIVIIVVIGSVFITQAQSYLNQNYIYVTGGAMINPDGAEIGLIVPKGDIYFGSPENYVSSTKSLITGTMNASSTGNFMELQKNELNTFRIDNNGNIYTSGIIQTGGEGLFPDGIDLSNGANIKMMLGSECPDGAYTLAKHFPAGHCSAQTGTCDQSTCAWNETWDGPNTENFGSCTFYAGNPCVQQTCVGTKSDFVICIGNF